MLNRFLKRKVLVFPVLTLNKQMLVGCQHFSEVILDVKLIYLLRIFNKRFLFSDLGGSIIYGKGKPFGACVTEFGSGYWWGCTHTNGWIYAPTIDSTIYNSGKADCQHEILSILHRNVF